MMASKRSHEKLIARSLDERKAIYSFTTHCKICQSSKLQFIGKKLGNYSKKMYYFYRCAECEYIFVANPDTDFENIYNMSYYRGKGVDPGVNYLFEFEHTDKTIRQYEWRGITNSVTKLMQLFNKRVDNNFMWLDYGCGTGSLVKYIQKHIGCTSLGYEEGIIKKFAINNGITILNSKDFDNYQGAFDMVTAIEVFEHVLDPIEVLKRIRSLLKPEGIFFYTTGNAGKFKVNFLQWNYVKPEIHISYFEPKTMEYALKRCGFKALYLEDNISFDKGIIIFKILKTLGVKKIALWQMLCPWNFITWIVNRKYGVSLFPIGQAI